MLNLDYNFARQIIEGLLHEVNFSDKFNLSIIDIANIIALSSFVYLLLIILIKGKTTNNDKHENLIWFFIAIPSVLNPILSFCGLVTFLYPKEIIIKYIIFIIAITNIIYFYVLSIFMIWGGFLKIRFMNHWANIQWSDIVFSLLLLVTWVLSHLLNIVSSAFALYNLFGSHEFGLLRVGLVIIATMISCGSVLGVSYLLRPNSAGAK